MLIVLGKGHGYRMGGGYRLGIQRENLDGLDEIGSAIGHLLGRLHKLAFGGGVGSPSRSQAAAVT